MTYKPKDCLLVYAIFCNSYFCDDWVPSGKKLLFKKYCYSSYCQSCALNMPDNCYVSHLLDKIRSIGVG